MSSRRLTLFCGLILFCCGLFLLKSPMASDIWNQISQKMLWVLKSQSGDLKNQKMKGSLNKPMVGSEEKNNTKIESKENSVMPLIQNEALRLYDVTISTREIEERFQRESQNLTLVQLQELREFVLDLKKDKDQRLVALYYLKEAGPRAHTHLQNIFFAPLLAQAFANKRNFDPHSLSARNDEFEYNLRVLALEGIESNIHSTQGQLSAVNLQAGMAAAANSYLNGLLKIVIAGEQAQRPLLKQFVDQNLHFNQENL